MIGKFSVASTPKSRKGSGYPIFISRFPLSISSYGSWISASAITAKKINPRIVASLFVGSRYFGMVSFSAWLAGCFPIVLYSGVSSGVSSFCIISFSISLVFFYV